MSKKLIASITLAAFTGLAVPTVAIESSSKESSLDVSGKVLLRKDGRWMDAQSGILTGATHIRTGADGNAVVVRTDGSTFRLAPNSQVDLAIGEGVVRLERGRLLGRAGSDLEVCTDRTSTLATKGEFVVFTTGAGTKLQVLSGDAKLVAEAGVVASADNEVAPEVYQADTLSKSQYAGDVAALDDQWKGNWKGKGTGDRSGDSDEAAGGTQGTSPNTNVNRPIERPSPPVNNNPPVNNPPVNNNPPVTSNPPVNNPPVTNNPPANNPTVGGGGGTPWVPIVLGVAAIGGLVAILANDGDGDDPVPSPSLP